MYWECQEKPDVDYLIVTYFRGNLISRKIEWGYYAGLIITAFHKIKYQVLPGPQSHVSSANQRSSEAVVPQGRTSSR